MKLKLKNIKKPTRVSCNEKNRKTLKGHMSPTHILLLNPIKRQ